MRIDAKETRGPAIFDVDGQSALIPLHTRSGAIQGYTRVDVSDVAFVTQWRWFYKKGYAARCEDVAGLPITFRLHRELLALTRHDERQVDHINRVKLDNRRINLRIVPKGSQPQNGPSYRNSSSRYRGVSWNRLEGKWKAYIRVDGKMQHLGTFTSETEAAAVAKAARLRLMPFAVD